MSLTAQEPCKIYCKSCGFTKTHIDVVDGSVNLGDSSIVAHKLKAKVNNSIKNVELTRSRAWAVASDLNPNGCPTCADNLVVSPINNEEN